MDAALRLHNQLADAGVPIDGVFRRPNGSFGVHYAAEATQAQKYLGEEIVAAFDGKDTKGRKHGDVVDDIKLMSDNEFKKALQHMLAEWLIDNPRFAARFNINIQGDQ